MKTIVHRGLTGSRIAVDLPEEIAPERVGTTVAHFSIAGVEREFTAGPRDLGAAVAAEFGISLTESFRLQRGTLRVGSKMELWTVPVDGYRFTNKHSVAVWEGVDRSVHTHLYDASTADAVALFGRFTIVETPEGAQMTPAADGVVVGRQPETLMLNLPVLGLMIVRKRADADGVPRWRGSTVAGGEVFCDKKDASQPVFMLAGASAVATILPDAPTRRLASVDHDAHWQRSVDMISLVKVGWTETR